MTPEHVQRSLDRIKAEAKKRASAFSSDNSVDQLATALQSGVKVAAKNAAAVACRTTLDKFYGIFEEASTTLREKLTENTSTQNMLVFPEGTRFHKQGHYTNIVVVEQRPQVRTLTIEGKNFKLAMPYTLFFIAYTNKDEHPHHEGDKNFTFMDLNVAFSNVPLKSMDEDVYAPPLPNTGHTSVCMGSYYGTTNSLAELADATIGEFWMSEFEGPGQHHYDKSDKSRSYLFFSIGKNRIVDFEGWQKVTESNPLEVLEANWGYPVKPQEIVDRAANTLENKNDQTINKIVSKAWNEMRDSLTLETAEKVVRTAVEGAVNILVEDLKNSALQSQKR